ncbi:MAG: Rrf2 family transcriptional regulator [Candidatus Omnitrophica bacterium]|nr:Rrf2 family transcriptional regulator [Candidatus Omnitrophota bacterium]
MELTAKADYAVRALVELALRYEGKKPVPLSVLCRQEHIPRNFLIQLLLRLKNAGLIGTVRGIAGGYYLSRPPSEISLAQIFQAVDERFVVSVTTKVKTQSQTQRVLLDIWRRINQTMIDTLKRLSLEELMVRLQNKEITYSI